MATSRVAALGAAATKTAEASRLEEIHRGVRWRRWGPYLSERQWGTVREDYSENGDAWGYLPHDHARSRAYRWGEDGLGGFGDDQLLLCLGLALWNGRDPILKERLFGLTNPEGNHGEDVKELYWYLEATPTHSYARALYKYPQRAFPYADLVAENRRRGKGEPEYELLDTGIFAEERYFDITVEYAKTRKQFGKPIGMFQAVQHHCADMYLETESSRSAVYYAGWALEEKSPDAPTAVSIAKMYASDAARSVGNRGIQVHGGMGFTWENDLHLYYRRAKASETAFGDATFHRERIASLVIDSGSVSARTA